MGGDAPGVARFALLAVSTEMKSALPNILCGILTVAGGVRARKIMTKNELRF